MRRTNTFEVRPQSTRDKLLLLEVLDASAALWNELTYARRQSFFQEQDVWAVDADQYRVQYKGILGSATAQQLIRRNDGAWRSFFALLEAGEEPSPPGYWKDDDQRELQTLIRNDHYTLEWGNRSRLEIAVGLELKDAYGLGYNERLRLEARGNPRWTGDQSRLELVYDESADAFRARQPVSDAHLRRDDSLATTPSGSGAVAALDIGANNLAAVTTTTGDQRIYHGRPAFHQFRRTTERIADLQRCLEEGDWSSERIRTLYRKRNLHRNHLQDALVRDLADWLTNHTVTEVIVGDLDDVLAPHWAAEVNENTHQFWAHGRFRRRLREVLDGEYSIRVREVAECGSSSTCPRCRGRTVVRRGDAFQCSDCGFEGHADLVASENLLADNVDEDGPMARPAAPRQNRRGDGHRSVPCLEWDDHRWQRRDHSTNENPVNRSTHTGKLAFGGSGAV
ncbi:RNA-guided endonuclease InsQ/TnpB family protein [Natronorubrum sp. FCH18a]|uniref:RNA-guided endonuclease InsQ/TnpB family protein n=1 Tax=Natronorubrum sp. FCH18a TaxID=3447018 RepID=UPI003F50F7B1